jgi:hypothetical protein
MIVRSKERWQLGILGHFSDWISPQTKRIKCIQQNLGFPRSDCYVPKPAERLLNPAHFVGAIAQVKRNEGPTKVVFTLEPYGNLVKLTVTHEGFVEGSRPLGGISKGWPAILSGLKSLLETGKVLAIPPVALGIEGFE